MSIRALDLPRDLAPLADLAIRTFQYPEHPEWGMQRDEQEEMLRTLRSFRRLWPLFRGLRILSPSLRDTYRGFVWEEEGEPIGVAVVQRRGTTAHWIIDTVGVAPEHRRKGIARALLTHSLEDLRRRAARRVTLGVIDRNLPAYSLYTGLGFETYGGSTKFECRPQDAPCVPPRPAGYAVEPIRLSDWRVRYEIDRRIVPQEQRAYDPVEVNHYRPPRLLASFLPLLRLVRRREERGISVRRLSDGQPVGFGRYSVPKCEGGVSSIRVLLDPACLELADYLVAYHLDRAIARGGGRRVDLFVPDWMTAIAESAERFGFTRRVHYHSLGLTL